MSECLIWSNYHRAWWRPGHRGYTLFAKDAGIYTSKEAIGVSWRGRDGWLEDGLAPDEIAVPIEMIPQDFRPDTSLNNTENSNEL